MTKVRLLICGSRDIKCTEENVAILRQFIRENVEELQGVKRSELEIVSGKARGADRLGEMLANQINVTVKGFPADWDTFGKSAGYVRNRKMAEYADILVATNGLTRGTENMISLAKQRRYGFKGIYVMPNDLLDW